MIKSRSEIVTISGASDSWTRATGTRDNTPSPVVNVAAWSEKTNTTDTMFPYVNRLDETKGSAMVRRNRKFLKSRDWGTNFHNEKISMSSTLWDVELAGRYTVYDYFCNHYGPVFMSTAFSKPPFSTETEEELLVAQLNSSGADAIARSRPGKPPVDLLVTAAELKREGIPSIISGMATRAWTIRELFREGGSDYLNITFGWQPLVKDIISLAQLASSTRQIVEQFERDIDRDIRRRYHFPDKVEVSSGRTEADNRYSFVSAHPIGNVNTTYVRPWQTISEVTEMNSTTTKSWFSGKFRWFFPEVAEGFEFFSRIEREANTLLGTRLDPEVLWNLQPWSWLIDWFLNSGSFMSNVSAFGIDGLVMKYGYIMQSTERRRVVGSPGIMARDNGSNLVRSSPPYENIQIFSRKARIKASPFGFGLNPDLDFSPKQWAILGALGLSQGLR